MNSENLSRYINDHLAGASGALELLDDLANRKGASNEAGFYRDFRQRVKQDFDFLTSLLESLNLSQDRLAQAGGVLTMKVGRLKMMWDGLNPPDLGYMEAVEMLELGVFGKKLLWIALAEIQPHCPALEGVDFAALIESAETQREELETRRRSVVQETLLHPHESIASE